MAAGADDVLAAAQRLRHAGRGRGRLPPGARLHRAQPAGRAGRAVAARGGRARRRRGRSAAARVALVFGRERTGLTNEELQLCHAAVHIPANPDYSSLNLAAAVQVLGYELRLALLATLADAGDAGERRRAEPPATMPSWKASSPNSPRPWTRSTSTRAARRNRPCASCAACSCAASLDRARGAPAARHPGRRAADGAAGRTTRD